MVGLRIGVAERMIHRTIRPRAGRTTAQLRFDPGAHRLDRPASVQRGFSLTRPLITPTRDELVAATEANYIAYFRGFAHLPQIEFHQDDAFIWFIANGAPGNPVLRTRLSEAEANARIPATLTELT